MKHCFLIQLEFNGIQLISTQLVSHLHLYFLSIHIFINAFDLFIPVIILDPFKFTSSVLFFGTTVLFDGSSIVLKLLK